MDVRPYAEGLIGNNAVRAGRKFSARELIAIPGRIARSAFWANLMADGRSPIGGFALDLLAAIFWSTGRYTSCKLPLAEVVEETRIR